MKRFSHIFCLLLTVAATFSCIRDNYDDCPPLQVGGLWLTFDMLNTRLKYTREVEHLDVYIFNMDGEPVRAGGPTPGTLVARLHYQLDNLRPEDFAARVDSLDPGDYYFLVTVNCNVYTLTQNYETYSSVETTLNSGYIGTAAPCDFLSGEIPITVTGEYQQENITLLRHNNNIKLNIIYKDYVLPDGMKLDSYIYGNNGLFDYSNHACPADVYAESTDWASQIDPDTNLPESFDLTTMRLCHERQVMLYLEEVPLDGTRADAQPRKLYIDMAAELSEKTDGKGDHPFDTDAELELHNEYEFTLTLNDDFTVGAISVTVSNWDSSGGDIEI